MKIEFVEIQNFRKLKSCHVAFSGKETIFIGANNSGKTSATHALILFLKQSCRKEIATTDLTLSNWHTINKIGTTWIECGKPEDLDLSIEQWLPVLPSIDIWLDVDTSEIHYVSHLIPTLSWTGGKLGVRLCFEPKKKGKSRIEELYKEFKKAFNSAAETASKNKNGGKIKLSLWPQSLKEFLEKEKRLHRYFAVNSYLLDPSQLVMPVDGVAKPQNLPEDSLRLDFEPFEGLFKIDIINAQRGFSDPNTSTSDSPGAGNTVGSLTTQLRSYFDKHLNPSEQPNEDDIEALIAIENATNEFDKKLKSSFSSAISELEDLGYPGFSDPQITLTSKVNPIDGLNHDSAVQFNVTNSDATSGQSPLSLPEKYNGLGYRNLISMVFKLIRFRDEWMRKGKAGKVLDNGDFIIEPLHLVLIEEPEAHLHAQVQQVFINKAYAVLRNHGDLEESEKLSTQMVVSTHSSHIAHEIDFGCLRYFRRRPADKKNNVPCATVVNLSTTFGEKDDTSKFATRYLRTTHCDLFFADAAILVEGSAERMLVPHFIKQRPVLDSLYITVLEIGGSHAHRLKPLVEDLGLVTLVVTDIDSIEEKKTAKVKPERDKKYRSGNNTLKSWLPKIKDLDGLLDLAEDKKISENSLVRVAYQCPINVSLTDGGEKEEAIPYTFEDALVLSNIQLFKDMNKSNGLIKKMSVALSKTSLSEATKEMFDALDKTKKKAEMALELLYLREPKELTPPAYISEGLDWLQEKLKNKDQDYLESDDNKCGGEE